MITVLDKDFPSCFGRSLAYVYNFKFKLRKTVKWYDSVVSIWTLPYREADSKMYGYHE